MKITLINPFHYFGLNRFLHRFFPVNGVTLPYLSRLIPAEHEVRIVNEAKETIDYDDPTDVVAISTLTVTANRAYRIADRFREKGIKVILGGPHVSAVPEEAKLHSDAVGIGNAETVLPKMISDLESGELKPLYNNRIPEKLPALKNLLTQNDTCSSMLASRGCEMNCEFCSMQNIFGKFYLQRERSEVLHDLNNVSTPNVFFLDDNFYGASRESRAFYSSILEKLAKSGKNWAAQCRLPAIQDDTTLDFFKKTNCNALLIGFESLNPKNNRQITKQRVDKEHYLNIIKKIHSYGIGVVGSFIFGFDYDTKETIQDSLQFCIESKMEIALFTVLTPFPGTTLYDRLEDEGRIINRNWDDYTMHKCVFKPIHFTPEELEQSVINATRKFYALSSIVKRSQFGMNYSYLKKYLPVNIYRNLALTSH